MTLINTNTSQEDDLDIDESELFLITCLFPHMIHGIDMSSLVQSFSVDTTFCWCAIYAAIWCTWLEQNTNIFREALFGLQSLIVDLSKWTNPTLQGQPNEGKLYIKSVLSQVYFSRGWVVIMLVLGRNIYQVGLDNLLVLTIKFILLIN